MSVINVNNNSKKKNNNRIKIIFTPGDWRTGVWTPMCLDHCAIKVLMNFPLEQVFWTFSGVFLWGDRLFRLVISTCDFVSFLRDSIIK